MTYLLQGLFGERSLTKVVGIFPTAAAAQASAQSLAAATGMSAGQVRTLGPEHARGSRNILLGQSMEPEQRGIARTMVRSHLVLGALGAAAGFALYTALRAAGVPMVLASPGVSLALALAFGAVFGLLAGGLVALRPDHISVISEVREALAVGSWAVVAHPVNPQQTESAAAHLTKAGARVLRSF